MSVCRRAPMRALADADLSPLQSPTPRSRIATLGLRIPSPWLPTSAPIHPHWDHHSHQLRPPGEESLREKKAALTLAALNSQLPGERNKKKKVSLSCWEKKKVVLPFSCSAWPGAEPVGTAAGRRCDKGERGVFPCLLTSSPKSSEPGARTSERLREESSAGASVEGSNRK